MIEQGDFWPKWFESILIPGLAALWILGVIAAVKWAPQPGDHGTGIPVADELSKLAALKAQGVLTEDEFQARKRRLLRL